MPASGQPDLFGEEPIDPGAARPAAHQPLAARMRPRRLSEVVGQEHILKPGSLLPRLVAQNRFGSLLFYGPPGCGKTSIAEAIARETGSRFVRLNAVMSNVAELRDILAAARRRPEAATILFIDEIHRFNKAQQDVLLPDVEAGVVRLIGATTHNPFFFVNAPLVSRSQIFELKPLSEDDILTLLDRALHDADRGLGHQRIAAGPDALRHLARVSDGDARKALNSLEIAALTTPPGPDGVIRIDIATAEQCIQKKAVVYDGDGDAHYDTISAFIKSVRGSDVDAALYWLAKMIHAGEDPRFITRRLMILAAEDIGLADPMGLVVANSAAQAFEFVGMPEGIFSIVEAVLYLATAPKSNTTTAYFKAFQTVELEGKGEVPKHLHDRHRPRKPGFVQHAGGLEVAAGILCLAAALVQWWPDRPASAPSVDV